VTGQILCQNLVEPAPRDRFFGQVIDLVMHQAGQCRLHPRSSSMRTLVVSSLLIIPLHAVADDAKLFSSVSKLEKLWGEGAFTEGPCEGPDGCIYFSDIGNRIMKFDPSTMKTSVHRDPSGRSNGMKFDKDGRLFACEGANTGGNRRVSVTDKDGKIKTLADSFMGKRFNSPNDLTLDVKGRVYFTDPRYTGSEKIELETQSVYRIDPDGKVTRIISDVQKPNGIVLSPDQKTLYLAESNSDPKAGRFLLSFPLKEDGTVGTEKKLVDFGADRGIDGMTVTNDGHIVATAGRGKTAGVSVFTPEGKKVAFLETPEAPTNCCFAGKNKQILYITAGKTLYRVETLMSGAK
jgi:gluconolactonase